MPCSEGINILTPSTSVPWISAEVSSLYRLPKHTALTKDNTSPCPSDTWAVFIFLPLGPPTMVSYRSYNYSVFWLVFYGTRAPSASTKAQRILPQRTVASWESSKEFHPITPFKYWSVCTLLRWAILLWSTQCISLAMVLKQNTISGFK